MATKEGGGLEKDKGKDVKYADQEFDLDKDLSRLKKSSYVLIAALIILVAAFCVLMIFSLSRTFTLEQSSDVPTILQFVYPVNDNVVATKEPVTETDTVATLKKADRLLEVKRIPGYVRVEWNTSHAGWVESGKLTTRLEMAAEGAGLGRAPLEILISPELFQKDVLVSGKVVNAADRALKNLQLIVYFLNAHHEVIGSEQTVLATRDDLPPGGATPFNIVGHGMMGRASFVAYEIPALELARGAASSPMVEDAGNAPAAPGAATPATKMPANKMPPKAPGVKK
jgi:hypothetical protein